MVEGVIHVLLSIDFAYEGIQLLVPRIFAKNLDIGTML